MTSFDLGKITEALTDLKEYGISFSGQQKKWESEKDGNFAIPIVFLVYSLKSH
jgi:hypothetical protein